MCFNAFLYRNLKINFYLCNLKLLYFFVMDGKSLSPHIDKLNQLKQIIPEAFFEGKINWEKLLVTLGEIDVFANERYVLN